MVVTAAEVWGPMVSGLVGGGVVVIFVRWGLASAAKDFIAIGVEERPAAVMAALRAQPGEFKKWNNEVYASELARSEASAAAITALRQEFAHHRTLIEPHFELLAQIPQSFRSLGEAIDRLNSTVTKIDDAHRQHDRDIAVLKAASRGAA